MPTQIWFRVLGVILVVVALGFSQTGCTLRGGPLDTSSSALPNPQGSVACLDLSDIDGKTIRVPENVTQIDSRGLALCSANTAASITFPPAIVFILDQSGSMETGGGDPNKQRAIVVRNAIQQFFNTAGSGYFSFIEFASDIEIPLAQSANPANLNNLNTGATNLLSQNFLPLNDSIVGIWASSTSPIQRRYAGGTNYVAPLQRAKEYINALRADPTKQVGDISVIFISDGAPTQPNGGAMANILAVLDTNYTVPGTFVPIHGIFLGQNGTALQALADSTSGSYQAIDPANPNSLGTILDSLVRSIALGGKPTNLAMNVDGVAYSSRSMSLDSAGGYQVSLNAAIPLDSGKNVINMDVQYLLENGSVANKTIQFTLDVTDSPVDTNYFTAGGYFVGYCPEVNTLTVVGIGTTGYPNVIDPDTATTLDFTFSPTRYSDSVATLTIVSATTGDIEVITIPVSLSPAGLAAYASSIPLQVTNGSHVDGDGRLQVTASDTVFFHWVNPQDSRDTLNWFVLLGPSQKPFAPDYSFRMWETDSVGTLIKNLADKSAGEIYPTGSVTAKQLAPSFVLMRRLVSGMGPDNMQYALLSGDTATFMLRGDTLVLRRMLDYETDSTLQVSYSVSDGKLSDTGSIQIAVLNVNEFGYQKTYIVLKDHSLQPGDLVDLLNQPDPEGDVVTMRVLASKDGTFALNGNALTTQSLLPFKVGNVYMVPVEISDGTRTDTIYVEIHMVSPPLEGVDTYLRHVAYQSGMLTVETGPGLLQVHSIAGDRKFTQWIQADGTSIITLELDPGIYVITVGCSKQTLVVTGN